MIKQDLGEGKETVEKRLVYCEGELYVNASSKTAACLLCFRKRLAAIMKETEKKLEIHREVIGKIQQQVAANK